MAAATRTEEVLAVLRRRSSEPQLFRGFGPLVAGAIFVLAMILLLPSVAPERIAERPADTTTTTTESGG